MGLDFYNPLEAKAHMDVNELNEKYGEQIGSCGNNDVMTWEGGDINKIRNEILHKLHAAKGGGFIFQSDHPVSSSVSGEIPIRQFSNQPKMIMWVFHLAIKKQIMKHMIISLSWFGNMEIIHSINCQSYYK